MTHHLATAALFPVMIPFGIPKPLSRALVFLYWPQKPCRNVPTSLIFERATWLAELRPPFVCAGAVVWKQPPPADVCTCLCLIGNLPTVTVSHLPFSGWRMRECVQLANCGAGTCGANGSLNEILKDGSCQCLVWKHPSVSRTVSKKKKSPSPKLPFSFSC